MGVVWGAAAAPAAPAAPTPDGTHISVGGGHTRAGAGTTGTAAAAGVARTAGSTGTGALPPLPSSQP